MRSRICLLVAVLLVASSPFMATSPAFAGGGAQGDFEIGGFAGRAWLDDYVPFQPEQGFLYGARLGFFLTDHLSLEASAQRITADTEFDTLGVSDVDLDLDALRLNLLYNFGSPGDKLRFFLTAGGGREEFDGDAEDLEQLDDIGWNAGAGFRLFLSRAVNLRLDGRFVRVDFDELEDEAQNNIEANLGLSLLFGGGGEEEVAEAPPANLPPTVACAADRAEILPGETVNLTATASDPEGGSLTYVWTTTAGQVTGTGPTATLNFGAATPPASANVTVQVTDDRGNSASSDCAVRLVEPVRKAEAVSCTAGGFPTNRARLTNVDKACLDDVAQRLRSDPRARVVVVGHADAGETNPTQVSQQRADAVKDYLVRERAIEEARITVRSSGSSKPAGTAIENRRVEVWFVPEGATVPE